MAVFMGEARTQGEGDIKPCRLEAEGQSSEAERQEGIQLFLGFQPVQKLHSGALHEVRPPPSSLIWVPCAGTFCNRE